MALYQIQLAIVQALNPPQCHHWGVAQLLPQQHWPQLASTEQRNTATAVAG
jgi:hypothetical protein